MPALKRSLRIEEAAEALHVSRRTVYNWIARGILIVAEPRPPWGWRVTAASVKACHVQARPAGRSLWHEHRSGVVHDES